MQRLSQKDLISIKFLSLDDLYLIFETARTLKSLHKAGIRHTPLEGKTLAMIFEKPSTRTRVSFQVGMYQLGGNAIYLNVQDIQLGRGKETIADTARVLSRYVDGIMARVFEHSKIEELARYSQVPVINGLSDLLHPCQVISDLFTILEKKQRLKGLTLAYVGDGNNVAHSLLYGTSKVGMNIRIASPKGFEPNTEIVKDAQEIAKKMNSEVIITNDPKEAVKNADIIYTDVWASMGQEAERAKRQEIFKDFQVNTNLLKYAKEDVMVMHCLPAYRNEEITDEVMDGPNSIIFDQAENRLHAQKAILALML